MIPIEVRLTQNITQHQKHTQLHIFPNLASIAHCIYFTNKYTTPQLPSNIIPLTTKVNRILAIVAQNNTAYLPNILSHFKSSWISVIATIACLSTLCISLLKKIHKALSSQNNPTGDFALNLQSFSGNIHHPSSSLRNRVYC